MSKMVLITLSGLLLSPSLKAGIVEPFVKWENRSVVVCFASRNELPQVALNRDVSATDVGGKILDTNIIEWGDKQMSAVREIITQEYKSARTGIEFIGFKKCLPYVPADAFIFAGDYGPWGRSAMGRDGVFVMKDKKLPMNLNTSWEMRVDETSKHPFIFLRIPDKESKGILQVSKEEALQLNAVHEFGHLAGLSHEHIRANISSPDCVSGHVQLQLRVASTLDVGDYDPQSIMNYCYTKNILEVHGLHKKKIGLSPGDIQALKSLYP